MWEESKFGKKSHIKRKHKREIHLLFDNIFTFISSFLWVEELHNRTNLTSHSVNSQPSLQAEIVIFELTSLYYAYIQRATRKSSIQFIGDWLCREENLKRLTLAPSLNSCCQWRCHPSRHLFPVSFSIFVYLRKWICKKKHIFTQQWWGL